MTARLPPISFSRRDRAAADALREYETSHPPVLSPCIDQTAKDIEAYYRAANVGDVAVVRQTQYHRVHYTVTAVSAVPVRVGRVYVEGFGAFYRKSGKNCFHPTGQTRLVVPTDQVLAWATAHPHGKLDVTYRRRGEGDAE